MASTPIYGLRYQELGDPPDGPALGKNLAEDVEDVVNGIDQRLQTTETDVAALQSATAHIIDSGWTDLATFSTHWTTPIKARLKDGVCYMIANIGKTGTAQTVGAEVTIVSSLPENIRPAYDLYTIGNMFLNGTNNQRGTFMVKIASAGTITTFITNESGSLSNTGVLRFTVAYPV